MPPPSKRSFRARGRRGRGRRRARRRPRAARGRSALRVRAFPVRDQARRVRSRTQGEQRSKTRSIPFFSWIMTECRKAVAASHGMSAAFSPDPKRNSRPSRSPRRSTWRLGAARCRGTSRQGGSSGGSRRIHSSSPRSAKKAITSAKTGASHGAGLRGHGGRAGSRPLRSP